MPNYCDYEMKVIGKKEDIQRLLNCLQADYNYRAGKPEHKHFFRVFEAEEAGTAKDNGNGTYTQYIYGYCAWSVWSCMMEGRSTYYSDCKEHYGEDFMGTTLVEQSQGLTIEVFSEEPGMEFSEHYIFKNGECVCNEETKIAQGGYTKSGKPTKRIDWDTYEGDTIIFNSFREGETGDFVYSV